MYSGVIICSGSIRGGEGVVSLSSVVMEARVCVEVGFLDSYGKMHGGEIINSYITRSDKQYATNLVTLALIQVKYTTRAAKDPILPICIVIMKEHLFLRKIRAFFDIVEPCNRFAPVNVDYKLGSVEKLRKRRPFSLLSIGP